MCGQCCKRLMENSLFVKAEKCKFHSTSVAFLHYRSKECPEGPGKGLRGPRLAGSRLLEAATTLFGVR